MGGVVNYVVNTVEGAVDLVSDFANDIGIGNVFESAGKGLLKTGEHLVNNVLDSAMPLILDIPTLGNGNAAWYVLGGEKYRDSKELETLANRLNSYSSQMETIQQRLEAKRYLESTFSSVDSRQMKSLKIDYDALKSQYDNLANEINARSDANWLGNAMLFVPNVVGTFVYSLYDYIKTGNSASLRQALSIGLMIGILIYSILQAISTFGAAMFTPQWWSTVAYSLAAISSLLALDAMVNNSGMLGVVFKIFDVIANDMLRLNGLAKGFNNFKTDSPYYQESLNDFRIMVTISSISTALYSSYLSSIATKSEKAAMEASKKAMAEKTTFSFESIGVTISSDGIKFGNSLADKFSGSLSEMYTSYNQAIGIKDFFSMFTLHNKMQKQLEEYKDSINKKMAEANKLKMESAYSDAEYIMNQTDLSYHSYVLSMSETGMSDVYDPEGTVVMNTRYRPQPAYTFGFEDLFQYNSMAGGDTYIYKTLWGKT